MKRLLLLLVAIGSVGSLALAQSDQDTYVFQSPFPYDTLDPILSYDTASWGIIENVYETLYTYDGESITEYVPMLATSHEVSEDGLTYTFQLRDGATFHSGNPFSCKDVEYSIERGLVVNASDSGFWFMAEALLDTGDNAAALLGEDATESDYQQYWENIENSVVCPEGPDGLVVEFHLPTIDPAFFIKMMAANTSIVDMQWAIENGMWDGTQETWRDWVGADMHEYYLQDHASGTGAYQLVSANSDRVVAERFDDYWGEAPDIEEVLIEYVDEQATNILALQQGDADRIEGLNWATIEAQIRGLPGVVVHSEPSWTSLSVGAIHLNQDVTVKDNPNVGSGKLDGSGIPSDFFSDINVRKGFAYSFDPVTFMEQLYTGKGTILTMALPPSFLGYNEELEPFTYDPEKAEEFFKAAWDGQVWEKGFELTIAYNSGNTTRQTIAQILKDNIEALNPKFKINIRGITWPDFLQARQDLLLPVSLVSWVPDYADSDNYIHTFYHSEGYYGSQMNFANAEMDEMIETARSITDQERRAELYRQVGALAHELTPTIPYPTAQAFIVTRDSLEGVYYNPMLSHSYRWKDISKN